MSYVQESREEIECYLSRCVRSKTIRYGSRQRNEKYWKSIYINKYKRLIFLLLKYFCKITDHLKQIIILQFEIFNILRSKMYDNDNTKARKETMNSYSHKTLQFSADVKILLLFLL